MLSIIIPTLNEEKYLPRLVASIREQGCSDYEIIVSDAGSKDRTAALATELGCRLVQDTEHHHPSWQRNIGAAQAHGDLLLFLDADTVLQKSFLPEVLDQFDSRKLTGAGFYFDFNPNKLCYKLYAAIYNVFCFFRQYHAPAAVGAGIISRRLAHEKIGGFDTSLTLAEDYDYCTRLSYVGRFRMIRGIRLLYSSRRLEKDGVLLTGWRWMRMGFYTLFNRRITKDKIPYGFGDF